jgi:hypothetical protein
MRIRIAVLIACSQTLFFADADAVESIQAYCDEINDRIQSGVLMGVDLSIDMYYQDTGEQTTNLKFYYEQGLEEGGMSREPVLEKVLVEYGTASGVFYYIEYFYGENGDLVFHYLHSTGYECGEKRFYFNEGRLLKLKVNPIDDVHSVKSALTKKYEVYEAAGNFRDRDRTEADHVLKKADEYKKIFASVIAAEGVEK